MYARTTTIQAQPSSVDAGIVHLRDEVMPALLAVEGCVGLSLMADRHSGRCMATTAWESEEAMRAGGASVESIRRDAARAFGGTVDTVEQWEIAVLHRDHRTGEGACARCTWLQGDPGAIDRAIDAFRAGVLPQIESMDGFCSASLFVDRATGRAVAVTAWDGHDAMDSGREHANRVRSSASQDIDARVLEVAEFDLAVAHLRVPEMA
ncbi:antibiotic biosynthesis monooxygenase [Rhodococcus olei]|uniref:Antibiotic biosynthesis monooxygenase n=1 Tax=Rhodococcus olei TaxID=2161675 RepID=A0ABP8NPL1_9NOCA